MKPLLVADLDFYAGELPNLHPDTPRVIRARLRCAPQTIASPIVEDMNKYEADFLITSQDARRLAVDLCRAAEEIEAVIVSFDCLPTTSGVLR